MLSNKLLRKEKIKPKIKRYALPSTQIDQNHQKNDVDKKREIVSTQKRKKKKIKKYKQIPINPNREKSLNYKGGQ